MSSLVYIQPALTTLTFIESNVHSLFLRILLPSYNRFTFENASASLSGKRRECEWEIFKLRICRYCTFIRLLCSAKIGYVDMIKLSFLFSQICSDASCLMLAYLGQLSWLMASDGPRLIILGFAMTHKQQL